jgi:hypothetical protein
VNYCFLDGSCPTTAAASLREGACRSVFLHNKPATATRANRRVCWQGEMTAFCCILFCSVPVLTRTLYFRQAASLGRIAAREGTSSYCRPATALVRLDRASSSPQMELALPPCSPARRPSARTRRLRVYLLGICRCFISRIVSVEERAYCLHLRPGAPPVFDATVG